MTNDSEFFNERYSRQLRLKGFGPEAQQKLTQASVLVIGAGGLGCPALQYLAGMGIGTIGIVDGDIVSLSNLHRQILYSEADIGLNKAKAAIAKLTAMNPLVKLECIAEHLTENNAASILKDYAVIVDATDNFSSRYLINDACVMLGKPFVYGAVQGFEGQVSVFNFEGGPTYRCLYPEQPGAEETQDCNEAGVLGVAPGIIGCHQALEVVKIITGIGTGLSGSLQIYDFLEGTNYKMKLRLNPENQSVTSLRNDYAADACEAGTKTIGPQELLTWQQAKQNFRLIDVRETAEFINGHLPGSVSLPLSSLNAGTVLPDAGHLVFICQKGHRSQKAVALLTNTNRQLSLRSLAGGLDAWTAVFGKKDLIYRC